MTQLKTVVMVTVVTVVIVTVVSVLTVTVVRVTVVCVTLVKIGVVTVVVVTFFSKNNLTPPKPMRFLRAAFRDLAMFYFLLALLPAHIEKCIAYSSPGYRILLTQLFQAVFPL